MFRRQTMTDKADINIPVAFYRKFTTDGGSVQWKSLLFSVCFPGGEDRCRRWPASHFTPLARMKGRKEPSRGERGAHMSET